MAMPSASGLFHRAIAQSVPGLCVTEDLATDIGIAIADELGVGSSADEIARVAASRLSEAADAVSATVSTRPRWGIAADLRSPFAPVVDAEVLPDAPWSALAAGASSDVDLVVGHTRDEYRLFLVATGELGQVTAEQADVALRALAPDPDGFRAGYAGAGPEQLYELVHSDVLFRMPSLRLGEVHAGRSYLYELAWDAPGMGGGVLGACHGLGLPLTFGNLAAGAAAFLIGEETAEAAELSRRVRRTWTTFAATGDPGWQVFSARERLTWVIDTEPAVRPYPEEVSRQLWADHAFAPVDLVGDDTHQVLE
jgi:para-nitrobenzyl esterase